MTTESIVALDSEVHKNMTVSPTPSLSIAKDKQFLPITVSEILSQGADFPVVWVKNHSTGAFELGILTSVKQGQNCALIDGDWLGNHVPGLLKNAPFKLIQVAEDQVQIGLDENSPLLNDGGERLFDDNGDVSSYMVERKQQLLEYYDSQRLTQAFTGFLEANNLLQKRSLHLKVGGDSDKIDGLYVVDETRLNQLDDTVFLDMRKRGLLPLIYAHFASLQQIARLSKRAAELAKGW
jgi:hypothetical protein